MLYLILVYTNPISEILDVVCYSDVYSSAPPQRTTDTKEYVDLVIWEPFCKAFKKSQEDGPFNKAAIKLWYEV